VICIIALLISILLPSLSKAREAASRTKCLSNLRQIGIAMVMYTNDNAGRFPAAAREDNTTAEDYIYWQEPFFIPGFMGLTSSRPAYDAVTHATAQQDQDMGALVRYMGKHFNPEVWICPSDSPEVHHTWLTSGPYKLQYPYSYSMNWMLSCYSPQYDSGYYNGNPSKMVNIKHSSTTVLMIEESELTIDDGNAIVMLVTGSSGNWTYDPGFYQSPTQMGNLLAIHHDSTRRMPDGIVTSNDLEGLPNSRARGNASFCDGHAEYVTREYVHGELGGHWDWSR
jgi:prepilin-type processing-associated H-X9-DG protein